MGHYEHIKFECKLSALGAELLTDFKEEGSWLELAKRHPEYAFLERAAEIANGGRISGNNQQTLLYLIERETLSEDFEIKYEYDSKIDHAKFDLLEFVLPFLAKGEVYSYYWNEFFDCDDFGLLPRKAEEILLPPRTPFLDWGRKFGESKTIYEL